jgi:hypothetical protein
MEAPEARASVKPPVISGSAAASPAVEPPQPKEPEQVSHSGAGEPITPTTGESVPLVKPAEPAKLVKPSEAAKPTPPVAPAETRRDAPPTRPALDKETPRSRPAISEIAEPKHHKATEKKTPLVAAGLALAAALIASGAYFLWPKLRTEVKAPVAVTSKPSTPVAPPNPLEIKQREAINAAEKLVATNDLENALQTVTEAEKLNGPLTAELQKMQGQIEDSIKDTRLRQVRQREAQLWQQAADKLKSQRYGEAQNYLRQVLALPEGGVHREEAQRNLSEVIPRLREQGKFLAQAQQALRQGDFGAARSFASQAQRSGGDVSQLNGEIDKSEGDRLAQLESEFGQLKEQDNDAAVQQLRTLQPKFKALASDGGPKSKEAQSYLDNTDVAIADIQARAQNKRLEVAFQSAVQKYQQAINADDKNALASASGALQPFAQGGSHAGEAQKYLSEINSKLAALNKPAPPPVVEPPPVAATKREAPPVSPIQSDVAVRAVVQRYQQAFEQRDADALRQIWPSMGERYKKFKEGFGAAKSIHMQVEIVEVKMGADGVSATVRAIQTQNYTPKGGGKTMSSKDQTVLYMVKANGNWVITQLQ